MKSYITDVNNGTSSVKAFMQISHYVDKDKYILFEFL